MRHLLKDNLPRPDRLRQVSLFVQESGGRSAGTSASGTWLPHLLYHHLNSCSLASGAQTRSSTVMSVSACKSMQPTVDLVILQSPYAFPPCRLCPACLALSCLPCCVLHCPALHQAALPCPTLPYLALALLALLGPVTHCIFKSAPLKDSAVFCLEARLDVYSHPGQVCFCVGCQPEHICFVLQEEACPQDWCCSRALGHHLGEPGDHQCSALAAAGLHTSHQPHHHFRRYVLAGCMGD